ncbi:Ankyrin repeat-containing domain [Pseudocohnilembus persalinus]|uniref:Ankyrin repeat-containing domain n=1 Tax=Pseudocohnilembus persalinus TaxID=266149 RepID=A0A0V0QUI8_PSEPJ|nr:Ankyrin repeat-containing domain [Pseudocohnilembus persalinus]|eukprot:KRX05938.1 Ankyrin repeat-containing domain [Pseudocohnilembus persalinus]
MGQTLVKEKLYSAIERSDDYTVRKIIEKYPQYINDAMTKDCQSTPLGRSAFRGDLKLCDLLLQLKADIDYSGPRKITPLMWAARRGQIIVVKFLVENGADVTLLCPDKFNVLEQSVLYGQYDIALYLITRIPKIAETLKPYETYENFVDLNRFRYVDYKNFIDHLLQKIPFSACPDFYTRPKPPPLKDPVQDPREPWKKWFSRVLEFGEPPMVERDELPENLQPQNRLMGKINCYLNGESPYPSNFYERQNYDNMIKSEAQLQKNKKIIKKKYDYLTNLNQQ